MQQYTQRGLISEPLDIITADWLKYQQLWADKNPTDIEWWPLIGLIINKDGVITEAVAIIWDSTGFH